MVIQNSRFLKNQKPVCLIRIFKNRVVHVTTHVDSPECFIHINVLKFHTELQTIQISHDIAKEPQSQNRESDDQKGVFHQFIVQAVLANISLKIDLRLNRLLVDQ